MSKKKVGIILVLLVVGAWLFIMPHGEQMESVKRTVAPIPDSVKVTDGEHMDFYFYGDGTGAFYVSEEKIVDFKYTVVDNGFDSKTFIIEQVHVNGKSLPHSSLKSAIFEIERGGSVDAEGFQGLPADDSKLEWHEL